MAVIGHCSSGRKLNAITSQFALADSGILELGRELVQEKIVTTAISVDDPEAKGRGLQGQLMSVRALPRFAAERGGGICVESM
jgi:hypothetical protein